MKRKIVVEYGEVNRIAELMGCTNVTVSCALSYRKNSRLARAIRKLAIERGGILIEKEESEPIHTGSHESALDGTVRI